MFSDANVDNRLRYAVRGRVIVQTTSTIVEFIERDLTRSIPLYSQAEYPDGFALVFSVELKGYLSFDPGSYVKIVELADYQRPYFDPLAYSLVKSADPYQPTIDSVSYYFHAQTNNFQLMVSVIPSQFGYNTYGSTQRWDTQAEVEAQFAPYVPGANWNGPKAYPHVFSLLS